MKFTFITTTFNTKIEDFAQMCMSLKNLEYEDWNILYADDGSDKQLRDKYIEILLNTTNHNNVLKIENHENIGICALRDKLINVFKSQIGDYLICIDSDDYVNKDFIKNIINVINTHKPDILKFNNFNFLYDETSFTAIEKKHNLVQTNDIFARIYRNELNIINFSDTIFFKNLHNTSADKKARLIAFLSTRISGPPSTIFRFQFYVKNNLKYTYTKTDSQNYNVLKNLDFGPVMMTSILEYNGVLMNNSEYNYRFNSASSVTRTFQNKDKIINEEIVRTFKSLLQQEDADNLKYIIFVYTLYLSYNNHDIKRVFAKFFKKNVRVNTLTNLSKIERIAYRFSRNSFTRWLFGLMLLIF